MKCYHGNSKTILNFTINLMIMNVQLHWNDGYHGYHGYSNLVLNDLHDVIGTVISVVLVQQFILVFVLVLVQT